MHKIIKACGLFACASSEPYCFPEIVKGPALCDAPDPKETLAPFQRVYINVNPGPVGDPSGGKFKKTMSVREPEDPVDYQKMIDELILASEKKEAEAYQKGVREGHQNGYSEGRQAGIAEGLNKIETMLHSLQQATQEIKKFQKALCLKAEKETVALSLAIARKILLQEPATNPEIIADVVKKTFETIAVNAPVRIRVNPSELAYMRDRRHLVPLEGDVTFVEDALISCGGCVVESLSGDVDARIESQIEMIREAFLPRLEKNNQALTEYPDGIL